MSGLHLPPHLQQLQNIPHFFSPKPDITTQELAILLAVINAIPPINQQLIMLLQSIEKASQNMNDGNPPVGLCRHFSTQEELQKRAQEQQAKNQQEGKRKDVGNSGVISKGNPNQITDGGG